MSDRVGSRVPHRAPILRSTIAPGGFGRPLTSTERRSLRALGWRVSERAIVVRASFDRPNAGTVYFPARGGGWNNAGIYVTRTTS